ncbi:threonine aldolase [Babesia caballi]|uniref:Threonine aldolase n=1 Tax=Babesia caballi TaxID=5871 RepID=A0AAV4LZ94_BABCB|nr:threonine aldolase [Babesia caballi]
MRHRAVPTYSVMQAANDRDVTTEVTGWSSSTNDGRSMNSMAFASLVARGTPSCADELSPHAMSWTHVEFAAFPVTYVALVGDDERVIRKRGHGVDLGHAYLRRQAFN